MAYNRPGLRRGRRPTALSGLRRGRRPTALALSTWGIGIPSTWRTGELLIPSRCISKCTSVYLVNLVMFSYI